MREVPSSILGMPLFFSVHFFLHNFYFLNDQAEKSPPWTEETPWLFVIRKYMKADLVPLAVQTQDNVRGSGNAHMKTIGQSNNLINFSHSRIHLVYLCNTKTYINELVERPNLRIS